MRITFIIVLMLSALNSLLFAEKDDPVAKKFKSKIAYAQKKYDSEIKKIKYGMIKDYKALMNKKMKAGNLAAANEIKAILDSLNGEGENLSKSDLDFGIPETKLDEILPSGRAINVAAAKNGGKVLPGPTNSQNLIDGNTTKYDGGTGFGYGTIPCLFVFEFAKKQHISYIQLLLWDGDTRFYRYKIETSADGKTWDALVDRSTGEHRSWQHIPFRPRKIKYVRIHGLGNSANSGFHIVEFEAYPAKPSKPPKPKYKSQR